MRPILAPFLLLTLVACVSTRPTVTDVWFDRDVDFRPLKTFAVRPVPTSVELNDTLAKEFEDAIRKHLTGRGYEATSGTPDFEVASRIEIVNLWHSGSARRRRGAEIELTVLLPDRSREVWRATATATGPDETVELPARIQAVLDLALRRFPPKPED